MARKETSGEVQRFDLLFTNYWDANKKYISEIQQTICFHMTGPGILKDNTSEENKCVITATANLILKEVRGMNVSSEYYPTI